MMTEHTPYQDEYFQDIQSGGFKKRSLLDRINPFTPFSSKKFVPSEKGQEFLDKFKKDTGKNLVVLPMSQGDINKANQSVGFTPDGLYKAYKGVGGSRDPFNRYVFLDEKNPSLYTLAHEGGHAQDKKLAYTNDPYRMDRRRESRTGKSMIPGGFLDQFNYFGKGAQNTVNQEIIAEKYATDYFKDKGLLKPTERQALQYETVKEEKFPYDDYQKFVEKQKPISYPLSFLKTYLSKTDNRFTPPMKGTSGSIRAQQKTYESLMEDPNRQRLFQGYLNPAFKRIEDMGYDTSNEKNRFNRDFNLNL
tara:strand:+ start:216 stop:1130 length:915 start_codon:yes stop_codon:yes gene_type:complete